MTILAVLLSVTVYSAVIYAAILLFRLIFKKQASPRMMYLVWLILILRLLIPVTFDTGFSLITLPSSSDGQTQNVLSVAENEPDVANSHTQAAVSAAPADNGQQKSGTRDSAAAQTGFTWGEPEGLAAAWILGMALMLAQSLASWIRIKLRIAHDAVYVPQEWLVIADNIKKELNIRDRVRIVLVRDFVSPALSAGIYPTIVMPEHMAV